MDLVDRELLQDLPPAGRLPGLGQVRAEAQNELLISRYSPVLWPEREVTMTAPCYIGKYEVTQEQYEAMMGMNPAFIKGPKNPVEGVSSGDAQEFCISFGVRRKS